MPDLDRDARLAADRDRLVDRWEDAVAFRAHMRRVGAAVFRCLGREGDQLVGLGIRCGRILKRGRDSDRAIEHRLADERLHAVELLRVRCLVPVAEHDTPHLRRPDVAAEIDAEPLLLEAGEELAEGAPVRRHAVVRPGDAVGGDHRVVERGGGLALAGEFRGDALKDLGWQLRRDENAISRIARACR